MTIHLYAEHLLNIRAISIQAVLLTVSNKETRATLSADGSCMSLSHDGQIAAIKLPISVPGGHNAATLTIPAVPTKELSFRVQLEEKPDSHGLLIAGTGPQDSIMPWTARSMNVDVQISCTHCQQVLLQRGAVKVWKDLPSENWAEMMDFWHCHRPHVHDASSSAPVKGYSADSTLALSPGVGMVDPVDFVLTPEDCCGLEMSTVDQQNGTSGAHLACMSCKTILGHVHTSGGYKLRKLHLTLSSSVQSDQPTSHEAEKWWSCLLLSSIECQGVRKFTASSTGPESHGLKLWVFTPDMTVSTSASNTKEPFRACKVFWQDCDLSTQDIGALNRQMLAEGELELPPDEMGELRAKLAESAELLPGSARKFQDWHVALLPRFTEADVQE